MEEVFTLFLVDFFRAQPDGNLLSWNELKGYINCFNTRLLYENEEFSSNQNRATTVGLVYSGLFKCVSATVGNKEKVDDLIFPGYNNVIADWDNFIDRSPSQHRIVCATTSLIIEISEHKFKSLCNHNPFLNSVTTKMIYQSCTAKQKLMKQYEGLDNKAIQQKFEATYPGITNWLTFIELAEFFNKHNNAFNKKNRIP